jgi:hypothetical protein
MRGQSHVPVRTGRKQGGASGAAMALAFVGAAVCLAACATVWGFQDLKAGDADAEVAEGDDSTPVADGGKEIGDVTEPGDTGAGDDASLGEDVKSTMDAGRARDAANDASNALDASEASDAVALMKCMAAGVCEGCCDPSGKCITQQSASACGMGGIACVNCNKTVTNCITGPACCGTTSGTCGCSAITLVCGAQ